MPGLHFHADGVQVADPGDGLRREGSRTDRPGPRWCDRPLHPPGLMLRRDVMAVGATVAALQVGERPDAGLFDRHSFMGVAHPEKRREWRIQTGLCIDRMGNSTLCSTVQMAPKYERESRWISRPRRSASAALAAIGLGGGLARMTPVLVVKWRSLGGRRGLRSDADRARNRHGHL